MEFKNIVECILFHQAINRQSDPNYSMCIPFSGFDDGEYMLTLTNYKNVAYVAIHHSTLKLINKGSWQQNTKENSCKLCAYACKQITYKKKNQQHQMTSKRQIKNMKCFKYDINFNCSNIPKLCDGLNY